MKMYIDKKMTELEERLTSMFRSEMIAMENRLDNRINRLEGQVRNSIRNIKTRVKGIEQRLGPNTEGFHSEEPMSDIGDLSR